MTCRLTPVAWDLLRMNRTGIPLLVFAALVAACGDSGGSAETGTGDDEDERDSGRPGIDEDSQDDDDTEGDDATTTPDTPSTGCTPGATRCAENRVLVCQPDGQTESLQETCPFACTAGRCVEPCDGTEKNYLGCGFIAVDLDNSSQSLFVGQPGADAQQFSITLSNPNAEPAEVTVIDGTGRLVAGPTVVPPLDLVILDLPRADANDTAIAAVGFRVISTVPITAHQFNPRQNSNVFSNDASLLLPVNSLGSEYLVLTWPTEVQNVPVVGPRVFPSYVTVAAAGEGTTQVTVTAPAGSGVAVAAGTGFAALNYGETRVVNLEAGQVLSMTTPAVDNADLTGMRIVANRPVAVFAGAECANVPHGVSYCDHIEEQVLPLNTWGQTYVVAKMQARGRERDLYRVLASVDGTVVTTVPSQPGAASVTLNAGQSLQFESDADFILTANHPISMAQFMVGSEYPTGDNFCNRDPEGGDPTSCAIPAEFTCTQITGIGDPAMLMLVPQEQFRTDYVVLTPADYLEDWLTLVSPATATLTLDGAPVTGPGEPISDSGLVAYRVSVNDGVHRLTGTEPFGLYAYGYDCNVSYSYAGGLNLTVR
jgi:hypothetical protein